MAPRPDKVSRAERMDQLAALLETDQLNLKQCSERLGFRSVGGGYALFKALELKTFGPDGLTREERRELRK